MILNSIQFMRQRNKVFFLGQFACVLLASLSLTASAQTLTDYSKPTGHFPNPFGPYLAHQVPPPSFGNAPRVETLLKNGKLSLSLSDAVALALENNLDLAIARFNLSIADTDIMRAKSGQAVRGVATGLVQGTPGGGIGGFGTGAPGAGAGGTSGGAGGAGTGASGLVQSTLGTGTPIDNFDPIVGGGLNLDHAAFPESSQVLYGVPTLKQNTGIANFNYSQGFASGTLMSVTFNNDRITSNSAFTFLSPELDTGFRLQLRQHLLAGFGFGPNLRYIRIARNNREISDVAFREQVIATVSQIENIYWDLVNAYEDVKVKERSLELAEKTLSDDREQVKIGAIAPMEVMKAESEEASASQDLLLSQNELQLQELLIKNAVTRDLSDPVLASAPVTPTDTMSIPEKEPVTPIQDLIGDAQEHRPELAEARMDLSNREITRKAAANALRPQVDLVAWYGTYGLGGVETPFGTDNGGSASTGGYSSAFNDLFKNNSPDYAVGFNISIPLRNRAAQADQIRSQLEYRQAQLHLQQLQNQIGIEVRNAQFALIQNRSRVEAARKARDLAQQTFDIEQKKKTLGASTSNLVLQAQRDLAQAESNFVSAMSTYEKSRVELDRATGLTLAHSGIEMMDAERGVVRGLPRFSGVAPRAEISVEQPRSDQN
ncbi:MAG TPA: TolC family protein [Terriglobales bacterium]|nr:TolC family protein [Terriglobales bacterium]